VRTGHDVGGLPHLGDRALGRRVARDQDALGIAQVLLGDRGDARRQRGGEERGLARLGRGIEDELEVLREAHVEHLVGLVEGDDAHRREVERAAAHVIERAAGGRDHDMHAAPERDDLPMELLPAIDRHDRDAEPAAVSMACLADLDGELARRDEDEGERLQWLGARRADELQDGQRERRRLSRSRRSLTKQIAPGEQRRNRRLLNRSGLPVAESREFLDKCLTEAERFKSIVHRQRVRESRRARAHQKPIPSSRLLDFGLAFLLAFLLAFFATAFFTTFLLAVFLPSFLPSGPRPVLASVFT